jgi:hypothetical protein
VRRTLHSPAELTVLRDLITAAMADCDAPGASAADREEMDRLTAYRGAVQDALRGRQVTPWHPDAQAMADFLAGEGPNPLTPLGHSHHWQDEPREATSAGARPTLSAWAQDVLALTAPVAAAPPPPGPRARTAPAAQPAGQHADSPAPAPAAPPTAWLDVVSADRARVRRLGARWERAEGAWKAPSPGLAIWAPWRRLPDVLEGEDRTFGQGLYVDMIPSTSWYRNVRSAVSERDWYRVSQMVRRRAGWRCEVCGVGINGDRDLLDAHERWRFDQATRVQRLTRLISLCAACHSVTHFGFATISGEAEDALRHLRYVTGMNVHEARRNIETAVATARRRSQVTWTLDLSVIASAGITVNTPGEGSRRSWAS